jgi:hypothetical protein
VRHFLRGGLVVFAAVMLWSSCGRKAPTQIQWAPSLDDALQTAFAENHPVVAEFWSDG